MHQLFCKLICWPLMCSSQQSAILTSRMPAHRGRIAVRILTASTLPCCRAVQMPGSAPWAALTHSRMSACKPVSTVLWLSSLCRP